MYLDDNDEDEDDGDDKDHVDYEFNSLETVCFLPKYYIASQSLSLVSCSDSRQFYFFYIL